MEPFVTHRGRIAVLDWSDVNTDLIIPARYLKRIERTGYGPLLFADKRYAAGAAPEADNPEKAGALNPEFPLNDPAVQGATVLVAGHNFGCGSSREHAVWAVQQGGFRAVIAPGKGEGFADIFEGNAFNNGLLPIELSPEDWRTIADAGKANPGKVEVTIDLAKQTVVLHAPGAADQRFTFDVSESDRNRLLKGLDAVAETLLRDDAISAFEKRIPAWVAPRAAGA
jgi:3-isopropylmalate/(R)-2-methylmalate dehydratase small subunit